MSVTGTTVAPVGRSDPWSPDRIAGDVVTAAAEIPADIVRLLVGPTVSLFGAVWCSIATGGSAMLEGLALSICASCNCRNPPSLETAYDSVIPPAGLVGKSNESACCGAIVVLVGLGSICGTNQTSVTKYDETSILMIVVSGLLLDCTFMMAFLDT